MLKTLTGAGAILQVAHHSPNGDLHGHSYEITAWWDDQPCAVEMQKKLMKWVEKFDHSCLPRKMSRAEEIGIQCLMALGCYMVDVDRPLERIYAKVINQ